MALDIYAIVTDKIIEALDKGIVPWQQPWDANTLPRSLSTRKPYRGCNVFLLAISAQLNGYNSPWWGTYKQIESRGGQVRKGEKATLVTFWKRLENDEVDEKGRKKSFMMLRYYNVFNLDQCDDVTAPKVPGEVEKKKFSPIEAAQEIVRSYINGEVDGEDGPTLTFIGDKAFYSPSKDAVVLPERSNFSSAENYYTTLFHELTHSTGHKNRLAREGVVENHFFGDETYSKEELIAEMGAAFLCGASGVSGTIENSASYIGHWLNVLKGDSKLVVQAAGQAQKAADLIQNISWDAKEEVA